MGMNQCSRKRLQYILRNPWILLSKCFLFASNKFSESLSSPCGLAAGVQCGHALILCGGPLVLFSGCLVQS